MRSPRPSTARRTRWTVVSSAYSGLYPPGTKRVTIGPSAQMPRLVFMSLHPFMRRTGGGAGASPVRRSSPVVPLDRRELDQVPEGVAAEEARPVRDRGLLARLDARLLEAEPPACDVLDLQAEMPLRGGIRLHGVGEEVELELTFARLEPDEVLV